MRDIVHNLGVITAIAPAVYVADNTPGAIDLLGFHSAAIVLHVGAGGITFTGTNKVEFKLTHSDDNVTYDPVLVTDLQNIGSVGAGGIIYALTAAHADPTVTKVGYKGNRRYLKLLADFAGTHATGTPFSAMVLKGHAEERPVA